MAKIKEITIGASYTYSPEPYHSERAELSITAEISDDEDPDVVAEDLRQQIVFNIALTLAHMDDELHQRIMQGADVDEIAKEMVQNQNSGMLESDTTIEKQEDDGGW